MYIKTAYNRSDTVGYGQIWSDTVTATGAGKNRKNYCMFKPRAVLQKSL
jgi:hypothetical protein